MTVTDSIPASRPDTVAVIPTTAPASVPVDTPVSTTHPAAAPAPATVPPPAPAPASVTTTAPAVAPVATPEPATAAQKPTVIPYLPNDSIAAADSVAAGPKSYGVLLEAPVAPEVPRKESDGFGMSCILAGLFLLFAIIGLRFRNNSKYVAALLRNMVEVRLRSNVFDETVRETSFIVLLNLLWSCSAGMVLCGLLAYTLPNEPTASFGITALTTRPALCTAVCMGVMILYTCLMALAYFMVGTVFSDVVHARMWLKGFLSSQGLLSAIFLPLSLMLLYYPGWSNYILWAALGFLLLGKIVFIWKGFRIFFTQISSWVLFLYYLCSLEIVPLILTYWAAGLLCSLL